MKIIVGLGNVGEKYSETRHNAGFLTINQFSKELEKEQEIQWKEEKKMKAHIAKCSYKGENILLVKPTTLMNLSGLSINQILSFYKEPLDNLTVIYDDIDLNLGTIRMRESGSAGTHNGMKSIIQELGSQDFTRIRIGIESRGDTAPAKQDLHSFVLSDFSAEEREILNHSIQEVILELKKAL